MSKRDAITPAVLRELLTYDAQTGTFSWKERDVSWFRPSARRSAAHICALWNSRYAGKPALTAASSFGHLRGMILGVQIQAHRAAWAWLHGAWPEDEIDHADGNPANNRMSNFLAVTHLMNCTNCAPHKKSSSLPAGVKHYPLKRIRPYQARICVEGRSHSLGYHATAEAAHAAYLAAAREHGFSPRHGRSIVQPPACIKGAGQ